MNDHEESEKLFALMRQHFAEDPEENLDALRECAARLEKDPKGALSQTLLVLHNMKGSAQAVGFLSFAALLHDMEEVLGGLHDGGSKDREFSQLIDGVETYFSLLAETLEDSPGLDRDCRVRLERLRASSSAGNPANQVGWGLFEETEPQALTEEDVQPRETVTEAKTEETEAGKYLLLEQNRRLFAIHLNEVKEIVSDHYLNPLPFSQSGLEGMIVVRNQALPVIELVAAGEAPQDDTHVCAVICEYEEQSFAFRVEKPRQVISLQDRDFESIAEKSSLQGGQHHLIKTVAKYDGQSVLIVDLKSMLCA
jgi:chemotaxis signal transduction protein